ncbi:hypothetical protein F4815DRAFT_496374 [Daldinia loculata]|uniref:uncharacterized protein n=1 Tax=Daldinia loculata TaxID=103429 RepID=UPI0020C51DC8|nr:uncharacterized protein F4817DRAFT_322984 [Daldinia loculata]KAI1652334.1 hypothetical protein F4817DRAFT_322984 [Daldinia loculata]KAI2775909.1 hypothetical protein F4815DRAFT_496374 [Daldinia loculata]
MPSSAVQNPLVQTESKSAKKKKAKAERTESPAPSALSVPEKAGSVAGQEGQDDSSESPYVRELQKNIRNLNKKISNSAKTDIIIDQHKDKSLDELVNARIINADQRTQRLKKPQLESQLAQLEEQLAQYKKVDEEYRTRIAAEKASLEKSLTEGFEKEKADAISEIKEQAAADSKKTQHDSLLVLSQFLRLAAARRTEEADAGLDENMALEGVLLNVYSGDENAVSTMIKLIEGSEEKTTSVSGDELQTTFAQVKAVSAAHATLFAAEVAAESTEASVETTNGTDPTVAHAGLTEIDSTGATAPLTNGHTESTPTSAPGVPENADVGDDAANAAAESQWDANNDLSASISQEEWVKVPRDPTETETGLTATPASTGNVQSWADEQPENPPESRAPAEANDGFHQVQRNRPRGDREGGWRGRGRGDYRGGWRGHGEGRGRGRGRGRGGMGRGGRPRTEES